MMQDGMSQTLVKVTNIKLGISTFWSMDKFERRLLQMRELYQVRDFFIYGAGTLYIEVIMQMLPPM